MTWHMCGPGYVGNVWTTCNGHGQGERLEAWARSRVYMADKARRDIGGPRWDWETRDGVLSWCAGGKELNFKCKIRSAWAGLSGLRQKLFQAACEDPELFGTSISYYQACMRCSFGYLLSWGFLALAACCILEGPKREVILLGWRSNMELNRLFLSRNRLSRHDIQLGIKSSQDISAGVTWWGWPIFCGPKHINIFQDNGRYSENQFGALIIGWRGFKCPRITEFVKKEGENRSHYAIICRFYWW